MPTYNERDNITTLINRLSAVLVDYDYEIVVVDDDSPDETWKVVEDRASEDRRVRLLRRIDRRGLSSAVVDGMVVADGSVLAVMDADLQHDEAALPHLISAVLDDEVDICLGSREAPGGGYGTFGPSRRLVSWGGAQLARRFLGIDIGDPMSGYFAVSRQRFDEVRAMINPRGFKVLLELVARGSRPRIGEIGYEFRSRTSGQTKLNSSVVVSYVLALAELTLTRMASARFALYAMLAVIGLSLRLSTESVLDLAGWSSVGPLLAAETATLFEFALHRRLTFADRSQSGLVRTLFRFHLVAAHSLFALFGATTLLETRLRSPESAAELALALAASSLAVVAVVVVGYGLNSTFTWSRSDSRPGGNR